jgi:hypothetical protein
MTKHFGLAFGSLIWQKIRCAIERWRFSVVSSARGIGELNREFSNMVKLFRQKDEVPTDNVPRTSTSSSSPLEKITSSVIMIVSTDPPDGWIARHIHSRLPSVRGGDFLKSHPSILFQEQRKQTQICFTIVRSILVALRCFSHAIHGEQR